MSTWKEDVDINQLNVLHGCALRFVASVAYYCTLHTTNINMADSEEEREEGQGLVVIVVKFGKHAKKLSVRKGAGEAELIDLCRNVSNACTKS